MAKGQVTIEMLMVFGAFILIIFAILVPTVFRAESYARDVQFTSDAKFASEKIATFASSVSNPYEKRSITLHLPGYTSSGNASNNKPRIQMGMCTTTSGSILNTTIALVRRNSTGALTMQETYSFTRNLGGGNWKTYINTGSGYVEKPIVEGHGKEYNITISWENITSTTVPSSTFNSCNDALIAWGAT